MNSYEVRIYSKTRARKRTKLGNKESRRCWTKVTSSSLYQAQKKATAVCTAGLVLLGISLSLLFLSSGSLGWFNNKYINRPPQKNLSTVYIVSAL